MSQTPPITGALAEILERTGELDRIIDGRGPTYERTVEIVQQPPPGPAQSFYIEPPDWDREHREFVAREREQRVREAAALLETVEEPPKPTPPAQPAAKQRRRWKAATG